MDTFNILAGVAGFIGLGLAIYGISNVTKRKSQKAVSKGKNSNAVIGNNSTITRGNKNEVINLKK